MAEVAPANQEATDAWSGVLFDRFVEFREIMTRGLGAHGEAALRAHPPEAGDAVLDIGCGFGDTSQRLAAMVGPDGTVLGIDVSEPFIELARAEAAGAGIDNLGFEVRDVQMMKLEPRFDYAFSRMGIMFFANPVAALRNVLAALVPGGRLCAVVWRRKLDNDWLHRAERIADEYLEEPEETDEPTCGPGPFSMANADTVTEQFAIAGFERISLERCDLPIMIGRDMDEAVRMNLAIGPAGELLRLVGEAAEEVRPEIERRLRKDLADLEGPSGVIAPASTWIISAKAPGAQPPPP
jgi:ubiquinone/menaquinone biosynthesis C-methylase UbiE